MSEGDKVYVLYDERAADGDPNDAIVLSSAWSIEEAREDAEEMGYPCVIYEYDEDAKGQLVNGRIVR